MDYLDNKLHIYNGIRHHQTLSRVDRMFSSSDYSDVLPAVNFVNTLLLCRDPNSKKSEKKQLQEIALNSISNMLLLNSAKKAPDTSSQTQDSPRASSIPFEIQDKFSLPESAQSVLIKLFPNKDGLSCFIRHHLPLVEKAESMDFIEKIVEQFNSIELLQNDIDQQQRQSLTLLSAQDLSSIQARIETRIRELNEAVVALPESDAPVSPRHKVSEADVPGVMTLVEKAEFPMKNVIPQKISVYTNFLPIY